MPFRLLTKRASNSKTVRVQTIANMHGKERNLTLILGIDIAKDISTYASDISGDGCSSTTGFTAIGSVRTQYVLYGGSVPGDNAESSLLGNSPSGTGPGV